MNQNRTHLVLIAAIFLLCGMESLNAQLMPQPWVDGTTLDQQKAVYERGEFQPKLFSAQLLPDSTGYSIWQIYYDVQAYSDA